MEQKTEKPIEFWLTPDMIDGQKTANIVSVRSETTQYGERLVALMTLEGIDPKYLFKKNLTRAEMGLLLAKRGKIEGKVVLGLEDITVSGNPRKAVRINGV